VLTPEHYPELAKGWAHIEINRINIPPTILRKKMEDLREVATSKSVPIGIVTI